MVTACATATVNNIPLLVFPADISASSATRYCSSWSRATALQSTTNDAFKPVCKYWDSITRPDMIMTALINAMRVLTDPAETGACCIALCQDVEGVVRSSRIILQERVHRITRSVAVEEELEDLAEVIAEAKKPLVVVGGWCLLLRSGETVEKFCEEFKIPFGERQAGKEPASLKRISYCLGGIGVKGTYASNIIAKDADVVLIGSRMSDFTTSFKRLFKNRM